ncbi:uncharacterized protein LOC115631738 [Scaptodrosophila lebanonensis]|uniref:Uncharacterized protein LOC115631738 n=1 Tax=Drosophila lebanonensis TaxID=7225 RepID=A0A6J2UB74_DROLE|nr:uncharacterized protein LOC115631738 [Scaptodrosophila lebanonensis]
MFANPYIKSVLWLLSLGGAGYGLMLLTEPSQEKIERIKASVPGASLTADQEKKALFMKKLQEAATTSTPIYRQAPNKKDD